MAEAAMIQVGRGRWLAPQVVEALAPHLTDRRRARIERVLAHRIGSVVFAVENLHHSHNGSACLRSAEAFGLQDVVAVESQIPFPEPASSEAFEIHRKVSKSTQRWLDLHRVGGTGELRAWADTRSMLIFGAQPAAGALALEEIPVTRPIMLVFGNELAGLQPDTLAACDGTFTIPMFGFVESLNVSVSVGIALQSVLGRVRAARGPGDLSRARRDHLRARWYARDLRGAELICRRKLGPSREAT